MFSGQGILTFKPKKNEYYFAVIFPSLVKAILIALSSYTYHISISQDYYAHSPHDPIIHTIISNALTLKGVLLLLLQSNLLWSFF